jgi:hypothetical protein
MVGVRTTGGGVTEISATTGDTLGPVTAGTRVWQRVAAESDGLCGVSLWVATYRKRIKSVATLTVFDADRRQVVRRAQVDTRDVADNTWCGFPFEPIADSASRAYWICFETDGTAEAVTLWTNDGVSDVCRKNDQDLDRAACFRCHYALGPVAVLDEVLFPGPEAPPPVGAGERAALDEIVRHCIETKGLYFLRLAHLADAFARAGGVRTVLSVGCGEGYQEAFLAGRVGGIDVVATDLHLIGPAFPFGNLRFQERDILAWPDREDFDFVFSIECLEHIEDYGLAFKHLATKVRPGGYW